MLTVNSWFHRETGDQFREITRPKDGKEYELSQSFRSLSLPRNCFRVFGAFYGGAQGPVYFGGFELLFRNDQFPQTMELASHVCSLASLFPGCEFFFQNCGLLLGKYFGRHQLVVLFPMDALDEVGEVARRIVDATKQKFPAWDGRKGDAVERLMFNPWAAPGERKKVQENAVRIRPQSKTEGWGIEYNYSDVVFQTAAPANKFVSACKMTLDASRWTHIHGVFPDTGYQCFEYHGPNPETAVPAAARNVAAIMGCEVVTH